MYVYVVASPLGGPVGDPWAVQRPPYLSPCCRWPIHEHSNSLSVESMIHVMDCYSTIYIYIYLYLCIYTQKYLIHMIYTNGALRHNTY